MLSTPPRIAAANLERKGFHTLYSVLVPSSFCRFNQKPIKKEVNIQTESINQSSNNIPEQRFSSRCKQLHQEPSF